MELILSAFRIIFCPIFHIIINYCSIYPRPPVSGEVWLSLFLFLHLLYSDNWSPFLECSLSLPPPEDWVPAVVCWWPVASAACAHSVLLTTSH